MKINAFIDGASRGNPGESGIGVLLIDEAGNTLASINGYIGKATNNIAEYTALIACLKKAKDLNCTKITIHSDSELLVRQMNRQYRVRNEGIKEIFERVQCVLRSAKGGFKCEIKHIKRELNRDADLLANAGIDSKQPIKI
ncbi:MAG: ribonuclease HI family protein [Bacteroidota bacterium]|nr:ribonuclease HI family protein [Bacteroidota bacterium]